MLFLDAIQFYGSFESVAEKLMMNMVDTEVEATQK